MCMGDILGVVVKGRGVTAQFCRCTRAEHWSRGVSQEGRLKRGAGMGGANGASKRNMDLPPLGPCFPDQLVSRRLEVSYPLNNGPVFRDSRTTSEEFRYLCAGVCSIMRGLSVCLCVFVGGGGEIDRGVG